MLKSRKFKSEFFYILFMVFSLFKKKGKNLAFFITLEPPIPYPSEETRWKIYGPINGNVCKIL